MAQNVAVTGKQGGEEYNCSLVSVVGWMVMVEGGSSALNFEFYLMDLRVIYYIKYKVNIKWEYSFQGSHSELITYRNVSLII